MAPKKVFCKTKQVTLPDTLAQRLQWLREHRGYSVAMLAEESGADEVLIEEIEGGIQLFMPTIIRQKLSRVLRVSPEVFSSAEKTIILPEEEAEYEMLATPLAYRYVPQQCPTCEVDLVQRKFKRYDVRGVAIDAISAHCPTCLYRMQAEG